MKTNLRSGNGHRPPTALLVALAMLLGGAPAALADHDDWNDRDDRDRHGYGGGYGSGGYDSHNGWNWEFGVSVGNRNDRWAPGPVAASQFPSLRGHGEWRWIGGANQYLWFPYVDRSWKPYFYGHWIHTRHGMTWVSYEPWGDVPHHYGNWVFVDHLGWGWVPGYDYAPACVTWGVVNGSIGWAPLPPPWYRSSRHHDYRHGRHGVDYRYNGDFRYNSGVDFDVWIFVSNEHFYGSAVHKHALDSRRSLSLFKEKKVLPVGRQLDAGYVKKVSPKNFRTVEVDRKNVSFGDRRGEFIAPREQDSRIRDGRKDVAKSVIRAPDPPRDTDRRKATDDRDRRLTDERPDRADKSDQAEKSERVEKADRSDKSERADKSGAANKSKESAEREGSRKAPPEKDRGGKSKTKGR